MTDRGGECCTDRECAPLSGRSADHPRYRLPYESVYGDTFTMDMSQTDPQTINADPVDYASSKAFGSPFVEAAWASICVRIRKDDSDLLLNFNDTQA